MNYQRSISPVRVDAVCCSMRSLGVEFAADGPRKFAPALVHSCFGPVPSASWWPRWWPAASVLELASGSALWPSIQLLACFEATGRAIDAPLWDVPGPDEAERAREVDGSRFCGLSRSARELQLDNPRDYWSQLNSFNEEDSYVPRKMYELFIPISTHLSNRHA